MTDPVRIELNERTLSDFYQGYINRKMIEHFHKYASAPQFDAWKVSGWNDGTATLHCVKKRNGKFLLFSFPDYGEPTMKEVSPKVEHVGWD
jgi:hypothetical protein